MSTRRSMLKSIGAWIATAFGTGLAAGSVAVSVPEDSPPSKKAQCIFYWSDEHNVIWGLTRKGDVIEVHQHRSKITNMIGRKVS